MKRLLFILAFVVAAFSLAAQASTIRDWGSTFELCYDTGDTIGITKSDCSVETDDNGYRVYIKRNGYPNIALQPSEFGYANAWLLRDFLRAVSKEGGLTARFNKASYPDSVFNLYLTDTISWYPITYNGTGDTAIVYGNVRPWDQ